MALLKQNEAGASVVDLCREHGMSQAQFYKWRAKFGGMDASMVKSFEELEKQNRRLATQWLWIYNNERLPTAIGGIAPR